MIGSLLRLRLRRTLLRLAPRRAAPGAGESEVRRRDHWSRDPLAHPVLQAMSQRDLGDLPFDPRRVTED